MAVFVYLLCAVAALGCAILLFRGYRQGGERLLLWSAVCFLCFTLNNALVALDLAVFPEVDLFLLRNGAGFVGVSVLLYGLIWSAR